MYDLPLKVSSSLKHTFLVYGSPCPALVGVAAFIIVIQIETTNTKIFTFFDFNSISVKSIAVSSKYRMPRITQKRNGSTKKCGKKLFLRFTQIYCKSINKFSKIIFNRQIETDCHFVCSVLIFLQLLRSWIALWFC